MKHFLCNAPLMIKILNEKVCMASSKTKLQKENIQCFPVSKPEQLLCNLYELMGQGLY